MMRTPNSPASRLALAATLLVTLALQAGCGRKVCDLRLTVVKAGVDLVDNPLANVTEVRISVISSDTLRDALTPVSFDPNTGSVSWTGMLKPNKSYRFEAVGLSSDGSIIARGGTAYIDTSVCGMDVTLFMAEAGAFRPTQTADRSPTPLLFSLAGHTMTRLKNGQVLIVGGATLDSAGGILELSNKVLIFNPNHGTFEELAINLRVGRAFHTSTLLKARVPGDPQQVLICGGVTSVNGELQATRLCELFDPGTMAFTYNLVEMREPRYGHTSTLLITGNVLVAGGGTLSDGQMLVDRIQPDQLTIGSVHDTADIFEFRTPPTFASETVEMNEQRMFHVAGRGAGNLVLVAGGQGQGGTVHKSTDIYNPGSNDFCVGVDLTTARSHATLVKLKATSELIIVGGREGASGNPTNRVERFILNTDCPGEAVELDIRLNGERWGHVATLLPDDEHILITGGVDRFGQAFQTAEVFMIDDLITEVVAMIHSRFLHAAVALLSGEVLITGGISVAPGQPAEPVLAAEIYTSRWD